MRPQVGVGEDDPIVSILQNLVEARDVEFKESQPFEKLKWKLVKTCMAMANLREGGQIVVGVSECNGNYERKGLQREHESGYDQDNLYALVNRYARPPVSLALRLVEFADRRFVWIEVRPFERTPVFCGIDMPNECGKDRLRVGEIPGRSRDRISTSKVHDADLVAEIIEVAAEKRAAEIIATAQRIGLRMPESDGNRFAEERADFGDFD